MTSIDDIIRLLEAAKSHGDNGVETANKAKGSPRTKKKQTNSPYKKAYASAFKKIAPKNKTKKGGWKKGGFRRTQKAAHAEAKRRTK